MIALQAVHAAHDRYMEARQVMRRDIELKFEAELLKLRIEESMAANRARVAGVSKAKIGRALGTSDWKTIEDRLALTSDQFTSKKELPQYTWDSETQSGVLYWVEWEGERIEGELPFTLGWSRIDQDVTMVWKAGTGSPIELWSFTDDRATEARFGLLNTIARSIKEEESR